MAVSLKLVCWTIENKVCSGCEQFILLYADELNDYAIESNKWEVYLRPHLYKLLTIKICISRQLYFLCTWDMLS